MIEKEEKSTALIMAISFYEKYLKILQAILKFECGNIEFRPLECEKQKG